MKKTLLIVAVVVLALAALSAGVAFAQGGYPPVTGYGRGMMGDGYGRGMMNGQGGYGPVHDYVEQALAAKLGLTEEQVEGQLAAGKSMYQIALDNGIAEADVQAVLTEVHKTAFAAAVKDGVMTQAQADAMLQRMSENGFGVNCPMGGAGNGTGNSYGRGMMGGRWGNQ